MIDALSEVLSRPTAVDDADFRLLYYSPQRGPLDQVRVESILHRDAPSAAKAWVRAQGVQQAVGVHRLEGAPHVGLLPRTYAPIRHEGKLLGYLWIIDADRTLSRSFDDRIAKVATELGPLLYRRHTLDLLDRQREHEAVRGLLWSDDPDVRARSAERLESSGVLAAGIRPRVVVVEIVVAPGETFDETEQLALEATLERARGRMAEPDVVHVATGPRAAVVLARRTAHGTEADVRAFARQLLDDCRRGLPGRRVVVGIGAGRERLADAQGSYHEALTVTRMLARADGLGDVRSHDELGVYETIARFPDSVLSPQLVPAPLRDLLDADVDGHLTTTLEAFLDAAGDVARVAQILHMHRSTVYARLRRVEEATRCRLDDGGTRLVLHLGLAIARTVGLWPERDVDDGHGQPDDRTAPSR